MGTFWTVVLLAAIVLAGGLAGWAVYLCLLVAAVAVFALIRLDRPWKPPNLRRTPNR